jgi:hypothetical protein
MAELERSNEYSSYDLIKLASQAQREGQSVEALNIMKEVIQQGTDKGEALDRGVFTKIIPYFQKAGLYLEMEPYCREHLFLHWNRSISRSLGHQPVDIQKAYFFLGVSQVYSKMALAAKREKQNTDEKTFLKEAKHYNTLFAQHLANGEQEQLEIEIKELIEIFGEDRTKWPSVFQRKFGINKE